MRKFLLISHGGLAKGALNSLRVFVRDTKNYTEISGYVDDCDPKIELNKFWQQVGEEDQVLIFTDIIGGSVNQLVLPMLERPNTYIFSGMNLPMLLQAACLAENADPEEIKKLEGVGKDGVVCMNDYKFEAFGEDDE